MRDLADLARAGYEILQQPFTHVDFEVHHTADRPGYLRDNIFVSRDPALSDPAGSGAAPIVIEALASAANGVGLVIGTNAGTDMLGPRRAYHSGSAAGLLIDEPTRRVFRGTALPNPTFLFESALTYEGIISVEPAPRSIKFYQSIEVRDLIREISRVAANVAGAPLLFLQAPAQLPAQSFIGQDVRSCKITPTKRSSSLAVRFAIALEQPSARLRFELTDILRRYCSHRGFGLWLADTRIGYRSGNWFQICPHADDLSRRDRRDRAASVDSHAVEVCLPVTFIGPARVGSTYAIMSFLSQFGDVGITSCSITTLDDVAFIHLQLSVSSVRRSSLSELNFRLAKSFAWAADPSDALIHVHEALTSAGTETLDYALAGDLSRRAGDYQTLVGPMLGCMMPERQRRIAVWFSWQMEGTGEELAIPLVELFRCFANIGLDQDASSPEAANSGTPNLEYLICRDIGNWVSRGRGKLSISEAEILTAFGGDRLESAAVRLCVSLEDAWKTSLRRRGARGVSELTVAWREWWLGHWASPI
jgi:hypothetical protein